MGKRTGQIAGLAALGALGYMLSKDKKGQSSQSETRPSQSETRPSAPSPARAAPEMQPITAAEGAGEVFKRPAQSSAVPTRVVTPTRIAPIAAPAVSNAYPDESRRGRMASMAPAAVNDQTSAPGDVPGAFAAVDRYHKETTGGTAPYAQGRYPMTKPQPTENTYSRKMGAEAGEAEAYKEATNRFKKETANMSPAVAQGRAPMTKRQPTANTYTRKMGAQAGEAEAYRAAKAREEAERRGLGVMKKGGAVKKMASGGMTSGASKRGDGIAQRGKTRGKLY